MSESDKQKAKERLTIYPVTVETIARDHRLTIKQLLKELK